MENFYMLALTVSDLEAYDPGKCGSLQDYARRRYEIRRDAIDSAATTYIPKEYPSSIPPPTRQLTEEEIKAFMKAEVDKWAEKE